jgi:hypothetical protein
MIEAHKTIRDKTTVEPWKLWINQHPDLNGREHRFTFGDIDIPEGVSVNWTLRGCRLDIFFAEVKTFGAEPNGSQRVVYSANHQVWRKMDGQYIQLGWRKGDDPKPVLINYLGTHLWKLSGNVPADEEWLELGDHIAIPSDEMWWDNEIVDAQTVVGFFSFKQDPRLNDHIIQCHHGVKGGCRLCR